MTQNKVIAVTGASRGIGSAIARNLAGRGFQVACLSRRGIGIEDADPGANSAERLRAYSCDVTGEASIQSALAKVAEDCGGLHGLVNNAGIHRDGRSESFTTPDFQQVLSTNALSTFSVSREAYPYLVAQGGGLIVNIGSYYDKHGIPRNTAYCASKAAIGAITRCLAVEWAKQNIRVVDVAPGFIRTDLNRDSWAQESFRNYIQKRVPLSRPGSADEVARLVGALFAEDIPFLTGETIYIDGGQGIAQ